jgi:elongation factor Tu
LGAGAIHKLLEAVDTWIPIPTRDLDKPLLFPVENTYSIGGRGTVVTGQIERGVLRKGDEVEFIGYKSKVKTTVTGVY